MHKERERDKSTVQKRRVCVGWSECSSMDLDQAGFCALNQSGPARVNRKSSNSYGGADKSLA